MSVEDDEEEDWLNKTIALSLEEETGVKFAKGENKTEHNNFQVARSQRQCLRMMMAMRRSEWKRPLPPPWKNKQVRICRKKGKADYLQTNSISGIDNEEILDHGEGVEEEVLKMAFEEPKWKIENTTRYMCVILGTKFARWKPNRNRSRVNNIDS